MAAKWLTVDDMQAQIGQYKVLSTLGTGTSAETFMAAGPDGRKVIGKRLMDSLVADKDVRARFLAASDASGRLRMRKYIAAVLGQRTGEEGAFLFREYVEGQSLAAIVASQGIRQLDTKRMIMDLCEGFRGMARAQVVHGGIHPGNVIIQRDGRIRLTDFGTGRAALHKYGEPYPLDASRYLAPEQIKGLAPSFASDIYSFALVMALLERGVCPVGGKDAGAIRQTILAGIQEPVPWLKTALALEPSKRHANVDAFVRAVEGHNKQEGERGGQENHEEAKRPVTAIFGRMGAIRDLKRNLDIYGHSEDNTVRLARSLQRRQYPLQLVNTGEGAMEVNARCRGQGVRVSPARVILPHGQIASMIISLDANADADSRVTLAWQEEENCKKCELRFQLEER